MGITYDNVYAYQMDKTYVIMSFTTSYNEITYLISMTKLSRTYL